MLATDLADVAQRFCFLKDANHLFFRESFAFYPVSQSIREKSNLPTGRLINGQINRFPRISRVVVKTFFTSLYPIACIVHIFGRMLNTNWFDCVAIFV
jgi:hypothetical protein